MYCGHCGTKLEENSKFCGKCGRRIGESSPAGKVDNSQPTAAVRNNPVSNQVRTEISNQAKVNSQIVQ